MFVVTDNVCGQCLNFVLPFLCVYKAQGHTTMIIMYIQNNDVDLEQCIFVHFVTLGQALLMQTIFSNSCLYLVQLANFYVIILC